MFITPFISAYQLNPPADWTEVNRFRDFAAKPTSTDIDKQSGFIPYTRNYMEAIYPNSRPRKSEITNKLDVTLSREDYEPVILALYGIKDIENISIEVKKLRSEFGEIGAENIEIRRIDLRAILPTNGKKSKHNYKFVPSILTKVNSGKIKKDSTTAFWLTIHCSNQVKEGEYRGTIQIKNNRKILRIIEFHITVLPIILKEIPDRLFSILYTPTNVAADLPNNSRLLLRDIREHGLNSYSPLAEAWGEPLQYDKLGKPEISPLVRHLQMAKEEGFWQPSILNLGKLIRTARPNLSANYTQFDEALDKKNLKNIIAYLEEERNKNDWPQIYYLPVDEPGAYTDTAGTKRVEITVELLDLIQKCKVKSAITVSDLVDNYHRQLPRWKNVVGWWDKMRPFSEVRIYQNGYPEGDTSLVKELADAKLRGHLAMLYENSSTMGTDPRVSRMYFGYFGWRTGVNGITSWTHPTWNLSTIKHVWDKGENSKREADRYYNDNHWSVPSSTICWEMVREGIDDAKYLYILERLIERKGADKRCLRLISDLKQAIDSTKMASKSPQCNWKTELFPSFRNRIINAILDLY